MDRFRAYRIHETDGVITAGLEELGLDDLTPGAVVIGACFSGINYKDALAATGKGNILRRFPLVGGIDVAGVVTATDDRRFRAGDRVVVTGCGLGESQDGGFSETVRVPADWVVTLPADLSLYDAMAIGTAGFTAALAIDRLEQNGLQPDQGPVIVSGATGGVGSIAIDLLSGCGYEVVALTGKAGEQTYLRGLGARQVLLRDDLVTGARPLEPARWAGAVDTVGGELLAWLTRTVKPWGSIASIGMAGGRELSTTVMPFILRGVSLLGITSANCAMPQRRRIWQRLAGDLRPRHLDAIVSGVVGLDEMPAVFEQLLAGQHRGRTVVQLTEAD